MHPVVGNSPNSQPAFEIRASAAKRDLVIKKIAFAIIAFINCGVIVGAYTFFVLYDINIPTKPFILASFAVGVVGAFVGLKSESVSTPSLGIDGRTFLGKAVTYLFFGPTEYLCRSLDWNDYSDPILGNAIVDDLKTASFVNLKDKYEASLSNLKRYGFINEDIRNKFKELALRIKVVSEELACLKKHAPAKGSAIAQRIRALEEQIAKVETEWAVYKGAFVSKLAGPAFATKVDPACPSVLAQAVVGEA